MIEAALFDLMKENCYAKITVSEITKRADISRRTFYRIYREKDDVLRGFLDRLCREYCRQVPVVEYYDIRQISRDFFGFWYQYREVLLRMHKSGVDELLYYEISRASAKVVRGRIDRNECKNVDGLWYFAQYSAGGFILLLCQWIQAGMNETPEEYAENISRALLEFVKPRENIGQADRTP